MSGDAEPVDEAEAALDRDMDFTELPLTDFKLPPARELDADDREVLMRKAITRIREGAKELVSHDAALEGADATPFRTTPADMWMLLLVRMVTRVSDPWEGNTSRPDDVKAEENGLAERSEIYERQDRLRHALCEYIMADFSGRCVALGVILIRSSRHIGYDSQPPG